jgi:hypothetical protein
MQDRQTIMVGRRQQAAAGDPGFCLRLAVNWLLWASRNVDRRAMLQIEGARRWS